jgi:hypothetical protein
MRQNRTELRVNTVIISGTELDVLYMKKPTTEMIEKKQMAKDGGGWR